jgi:hypothetical protein
MGFLAVDLAPVATTGPSVNIPPAKDLLLKAFTLARTDTTAVLKLVLPADATIVDVDVYGVASNAGTTATVSVGTTSANANEILNGQDVKTAGGRIRPTTAWSTNYPNVVGYPLGADIQIWAKYAETGGASTLGGPYTILVYYIR